jgi:Domain of unknown function (DUF4468) with TBP-like fold
MKKIIQVSMLLLFSVISKAQTDSINIVLPTKENRIFYESIITTKDSVKKSKIYLATKEWVSKSFKESKSVIDFEDKEDGKIICKFHSKSKKYNVGDELEVSCTLDFTIKDNKYRVQLYNFDVKENHYKILDGTTLNPMYPYTKIDIDKMNTQYITNGKRPWRRKYMIDIMSRTDFEVKLIINAVTEYIESAVNKDF